MAVAVEGVEGADLAFYLLVQDRSPARRIGANLVRRTRSDDLAIVQHADPRPEIEDDVHVVLGEKERGARSGRSDRSA